MKKIYKKIIIAIFLIYFVVTLISQQKTLNQYTKNYEDLTSQYIEEVAREKLDMYLPNERVYIDISK